MVGIFSEVGQGVLFCLPALVLTTWAHYDPAFAEQGIQKWRKALEKFQKHSSSACHTQAMTVWAELRDRIDALVDQQRAAEESQQQKEAKEKRQFLATIVDVLLFLAKQNIAIQGHDESAVSSNRGNFLELLDLMASLNPLFKAHLENVHAHHRNATYLSTDIQNELVDISAGMIREIIVKEVKEAEIFSIGIDETSDVSRREQVSFCFMICR